MRKAELEALVAKLQRSNQLQRKKLEEVRRVARECIDSNKGQVVSKSWLVETITETLTEAK